MERHAFAMKVKDDMMNSYRQKWGDMERSDFVPGQKSGKKFQYLEY